MSHELDSEVNLKDWMSQLPDAVKKRHITRITMPAAHDSVTGENKPQALYTPASTKKAKRLSKFMSTPVVGGIIAGFAITQNKTTAELLDGGVRCFDIRLMYDSLRNRYVCSHCVGFVDFPDIVDEFATFLRSHLGEVVVLAISEDWDHRDSLKVTAPRGHLLQALNVNAPPARARLPVNTSTGKIVRDSLLLDGEDDSTEVAFSTTSLDAIERNAPTTALEVLMEWLTQLSPLASLVYESQQTQEFGSVWQAPTLARCQKSNKRVIIATRALTWNANASQAVLRRVLEPSVADPDWADAQTMTALETHLRRRMQTLQHDDNTFSMLSFTHTPDGRIIRNYVLAKLFCCCCMTGQTPLTLSDSSLTLFDRMLSNTDDRATIRQYSTLQFDFLDETLCRKIIRLNYDA